MTIDAIILSKSSDIIHYGLTCRTINSLKESDGWTGDIYVVESEPEKSFKENGFVYSGCGVIFPECSFNYNKFLNIGVGVCDSDWLLICNNDLVFSKNWFLHMKEAMNSHTDILSFSPLCPNWHLHQNIMDDKLIEEGYTVSKQICGWCILLHRSIIHKCNLFDEQFEFWYQDNDYALSLKSKNEKHALVPKSRVYHMVSGSHDLLGNRSVELTYAQEHKFKNKWK